VADLVEIMVQTLGDGPRNGGRAPIESRAGAIIEPESLVGE
jgi:hypothetical protein